MCPDIYEYYTLGLYTGHGLWLISGVLISGIFWFILYLNIKKQRRNKDEKDRY